MLSKWLNERKITGFSETEALLRSAEICRVALMNGNYPYVAPMCFGYKITGGELELFFRCNENDKKAELVRACGQAAFEIDELVELVRSEGNGGHFSIPKFRSITGTGYIEVITGIEKITGLGHIMKKYGEYPEDNKLPEQIINALTILKLTVSELCCTEHNAQGAAEQ